MPTLELIAAIAANSIIGRQGQLPWHLPDDLRRFKALTTGHPILMGRKTYDSIGKPLPNRRNIVISQTMQTAPSGVELARSLDDALALVSIAEKVFIIGGSALYAAAFPKADVLHLTEVADAVEGDASFPTFDRSAWRLTEDLPHERDEKHAHAFHFRTYIRR